MTAIDSTARVATGAQIGKDVTIGPYCVVGPNVSIGDGCHLLTHVNISGRTTLGPRVRVSAFASLGTPPQSVHYKGEDTALTIGADCDIREHVTMNTATAKGAGVTRVGERCLIMVGSHVGHDCIVGNNVVFANNATVAGHVEVGDHVFLGGLCAVHQFVRIGEQAIIGGLVGVAFDVIPYASVVGHRGELAGLNRIGLRRRGMSTADIQSINKAYKELFFGSGTLKERVEMVAQTYSGDRNVMRIVEFIRGSKSRRLTTPRSARVDEDTD